MKIDVRPADSGGCGAYRLIWPAQVLAAAGHHIDLHDPLATIDTIRERGPLGDRLLAVDTDADVIVFQRPLRRDIVDIIPTLQAQGTAVVVEIDDDFHGLPEGHPARTEVSPARNPERNKLWLRRACELADLVTVSTPALAGTYGGHGRVMVLENCVPDTYLTVPPRPLRALSDTFGWTGSTHTHIDDLRVMGDAAARLIDDGHLLHIVGTGAGVPEQLELAGRRFSSTGWVPIDEYPAYYAALDVAVVPLQANRFNDAKSWLKGAEAAALGVPFVASPTAEYRRLAAEGVGGLADTPDEWHQAIDALLRSPALADDVAGVGRAWAAEWTYERRAWRWAEAWAHAVTLHHHRRAA